MGRYPWAEFILFQILRILVFYPTRLYAYRAIVFTAMVVLASKIYRTTETTDPVTLSYLVGVATAFHLTFTTYVLCTGGSFPDRWRRVRDGDLPETDDNSPLDFPLKKKLWWMFDIAHSARMIGWVQEPQGCLPRRPSPSRRTFLRETFLKLVFNMVIVDLSGSICSRSPRYDYRFPRNSTHGLRPAFAVPPLLRHAPHVIAFAVVAAASVAMFYNITSLVAVGVFRSSPTLWPDMWGNMGDGYTLRKFWGRSWHQTMRPMFSGLGRFIANDLLKFPRGTNQSSYAQLYIAFFLSGIVHFAGDFMSHKRMVYHSFQFFLLQAVAITFEDFVIYLTKQLLLQQGIKLNPGKANESWADTAVRVLGYFWVVLWFCLTVPAWRDKTNSFLCGVNGGALPISQLVLDAWKGWV